MTINGAPIVPLPAGAHVAGDWQQWGHKLRVIATERREIAPGIGVSLVACQLPDGSLLNDAKDYPKVVVEHRTEHGWSEGVEVSAADAPALARALVAGADELSGWARS